jgi:hypothetical protein
LNCKLASVLPPPPPPPPPSSAPSSGECLGFNPNPVLVLRDFSSLS